MKLYTTTAVQLLHFIAIQAGEGLADGGVWCCVIRQLDILKLFLMQVVRTDAYAPIRHRGSVVAWQDTVSCHCWFMGKKG